MQQPATLGISDQTRGSYERRLEYQIWVAAGAARSPPTLDEAIFAAIGITDDQQAQAEIAASLMDCRRIRSGRSEEGRPHRSAVFDAVSQASKARSAR